MRRVGVKRQSRGTGLVACRRSLGRGARPPAGRPESSSRWLLPEAPVRVAQAPARRQPTRRGAVASEPYPASDGAAECSLCSPGTPFLPVCTFDRPAHRVGSRVLPRPQPQHPVRCISHTVSLVKSGGTRTRRRCHGHQHQGGTEEVVPARRDHRRRWSGDGGEIVGGPRDAAGRPPERWVRYKKFTSAKRQGNRGAVAYGRGHFHRHANPRVRQGAASTGSAEEPIKIDVDRLNFYYGQKRALEGISVQLRANVVSAFIGPSGCGKSTFLRTLNRMNDLIPGTRVEGSVHIDGVNIYDPSLDVVGLRRRVGMVFQKSNPFPKSIFENVAYGLRINSLARNKTELNERARAACNPRRCGRKSRTGSTNRRWRCPGGSSSGCASRGRWR